MIACTTVRDPRPLRRRPALPLLALALLALSPAGPETSARADERSPALVSGRGELRVAIPGGETFRAELPAEVVVHAVAGVDGGAWVAAGTRARDAEGSPLVLFRGQGAAAEQVAVPEAGGPLAASPTPLVSGDDLLGLAWLAGDDPGRLSVRFAPWLGGATLPGAGGEWGEPEQVAGPAPGSQLALSGAALGDGSVVLAWSAFDGEDDEILWSVRSAGRWSEPARLGADNAVPDVTPALAALGDGAIAAWSRFDGGEYRLVAARYTGGGWSEPEPLAGPGSLFPELHPGERGPVLLYRDARRRGWTALRLDPAGRVTARAFLGVSAPDSAPALGAADLRWEDLP